jgi:hypothetical protein
LALALHDRERLKKILDLSDRLGNLRSRFQDGGTPKGREELVREVRSISGRVATIGLPGALGKAAEKHHLGPHEVCVLLLLLNRRLDPALGPLSGRDILATLFPSAFGILSGVSLLEDGSPLRESGALEIIQPEPEDLLEAGFEISDGLFRAIENDVSPARGRRRLRKPYENHWEHLADLGRLSSLMIRRSNAIFDVDAYGSRAFDDDEPASILHRRAEALAQEVESRLAATPAAEDFPLVRLARRLKLGEDEQLILVALLVQECYYGNPGLEAVDCVKMLCTGPEELLRKRKLLDAGGTLRREGLIELDEPVGEREMTADLALPRWVAAQMLGERDRDRDPIDPDTRLEFHEYLKGLGDSEQFYRDLDG